MRILPSWLLLLFFSSFAPAAETWPCAERHIGAWTVQVQTRLLDEKPDLAAQALALLEEKLDEIDPLLPPDKLTFLRERPIWLSQDDGAAAAFHPSRKWLSEHDRNPDMAGCIEICNAKNFIAWSGHQPMMVLHELAHALHFREHNFGHEALRKNYQAVKEAGIYDQVPHWDGADRSAYALTNHKEYFAELTEAYFGRNDIFPFTREELREHDPVGYALIEEIWQEPLAAAPDE